MKKAALIGALALVATAAIAHQQAEIEGRWELAEIDEERTFFTLADGAVFIESVSLTGAITEAALLGNYAIDHESKRIIFYNKAGVWIWSYQIQGDTATISLLFPSGQTAMTMTLYRRSAKDLMWGRHPE